MFTPPGSFPDSFPRADVVGEMQMDENSATDAKSSDPVVSGTPAGVGFPTDMIFLFEEEINNDHNV